MNRFFIYLFGVTGIGIGIGLILLANVGYGPWDIFYVNFVHLFDSSFVIVQTFMSLALVLIGFLIRKQKVDRSIIIITINSAYLAGWIDIMLRLPMNTNPVIGYIMLISGLTMIAVGVNMARFTAMVLPALDFFTRSIYLNTKLSYGRIKQIIEGIVLIIGLLIGFIFNLEFTLGFGTIIILFMGGHMINFTYDHVTRFLDKIVK